MGYLLFLQKVNRNGTYPLTTRKLFDTLEV